jgi:hypothetical protein
MRKTRSEFPKHDERNDDGFGLFQQFNSFRNAPAKIDISSSCRERSSLPHTLVNHVLFREGGFDPLLGLPCSSDIAETAAAGSQSGQTGTSGQRIDGGLIQALARRTCAHTQRLVQSRRNSSNRILHALIIGNACSTCKHSRRSDACGARDRITNPAPMFNCTRDYSRESSHCVRFPGNTRRRHGRGSRFRQKMNSENSADHVLVDVNSEAQSDLLGNPFATCGWRIRKSARLPSFCDALIRFAEWVLPQSTVGALTITR